MLLYRPTPALISRCMELPGKVEGKRGREAGRGGGRGEREKNGVGRRDRKEDEGKLERRNDEGNINEEGKEVLHVGEL